MPDDKRPALRHTFDYDAELYDRARPGYPEQLFEDLLVLGRLKPGDAVLEIGCGTGQATVSLARRGFRLLCVELGENLAAVARRKLAQFPHVEVVTSAFETWEPRGAKFDAIFAATSWHWLDPHVRYLKAARVLKPAGVLAIVSGGHACPPNFDPFFTQIQPCYEAIGEGDPTWPPPYYLPPGPDEVPDERTEIEQSGLFGDVRVRRYLWTVDYTADQYIDVLNTYSGHIAMEQWKRDKLYTEVRRLFEARPDGRIRKHYLSILHVARLIDPG